MTTIGYATLQIIPSLKGVTEAIEGQIDGKVVNVTIEPKVDQRAAEQAGKQTRETVEKHTTEVKVEPKVDTRAAEKTGKATGEAVTKGAKEAVRKGDIGGAVSDEIKESVEKSSVGRETAKILVDGIAGGVKSELGGGPLVDALVDGIADGVKQGIDDVGIGGQIVKTIGGAIKSGNLPGTIKDAVMPGIRQIGTEIRVGAADWASGIGDALRSGDIQGATEDVGNTVRTTTDIIATIGSTFGLQLDGVREFGSGSATTLETVGSNIQDIVNTATTMKSTFVETGDLLGAVLPGRAGSGAKSIINSLGTIIPIAAGVYEALDKITQDWHAGQQERFWERQEADRRARDAGVKPPQPGVGDFGGAPAVGQGNAPSAPVRPSLSEDMRAKIRSGQLPGYSLAPNGAIVGPDGKPLPGMSGGGFTGNFPIDKIAGVVHGGEHVIQATSRRTIENAHPGLLDYLNKNGQLPGYGGGGLVAGTAELGKIIKERFGISNIGGYRGADGYNEHSTGRALDVMVGANKAKGDAVKDFALANASAIDLKWAIWQQKLWSPNGSSKKMEDRGSPTANHMDHVHIFSGAGITNGLRGALKGEESDKRDSSAAPSVTDPAAGNQTPASTDASLVSSSSESSSGISMPSSISGLSTLGLNNLGSGIGKTSSGSDLSLFGNAGASAVSGQVSSALGVLGVGDSPGWLKGISTFVGGLSVSDSSGKKIFGGGGGAGPLAGLGNGFGGAAPVAASAPVGGAAQVPASTVHGSRGGGQPGPVFNTTISAFDTTDAVARWDQKKNEMVGAKLSHI